MYVCVLCCAVFKFGFPSISVYVWKSEDNLGELVLSFYHVGLRGHIQVLGAGGTFLYPLSHFTGLQMIDLKCYHRVCCVP